MAGLKTYNAKRRFGVTAEPKGKVARKSGAFANSIAIVTSRGKDGPVTAILAAAAPRPCRLDAAAGHIRGGASSDELR